ncbi:hypothetical protein ACIOHB_35450 [Streptomyces microflavus]|uniref:hypothetical protein n=1 Tax=Streptomyces microflavus TaxID=1919 RepID=UPI003809050E
MEETESAWQPQVRARGQGAGEPSVDVGRDVAAGSPGELVAYGFVPGARLELAQGVELFGAAAAVMQGPSWTVNWTSSSGGHLVRRAQHLPGRRVGEQRHRHLVR